MDDNTLPPLPVPPQDEQPEDEQPTGNPTPPSDQQPPWSQQPPAGQQPPSGQQPPWSQQPPVGQQPPWQQQPPSGQQPPWQQQPPSGQQPPWNQQPPAGQQPPWQQRPPSGQPPYGQPPSGQWGQQPPPGWVPSPDYDQRKAKTWDYYYPGQMQPGPYSGQPLKWYEVWLKALTPSVDAYHQILADPTWTVNRAYLWLILGMVINVIMDMVMGGGNLKTTSNFAGNNSTNYNYNAGSSLCCLPVSIGLGMLFFMIFAFITHAIAQAFGGRSDMNRLIYAIAAFSVPIALISWIPCVGFIVSLYALVLMVVAVKAVYEIGWFGATVSGLWPIPVFLICIFCFVFALAGAIAS